MLTAAAILSQPVSLVHAAYAEVVNPADAVVVDSSTADVKLGRAKLSQITEEVILLKNDLVRMQVH